MFNRGRRDVGWSICGFLFCAAVVLFVRSTQPLHPKGEHPMKALAVILGSFLALIFFMLSFFKLFCGHNDGDSSYEQLETGGQGAGAPRQYGENDDLAGRHLQQARRDMHSKGMVGEPQQSARSTYSSRYTPREEEDIEAGVELSVEKDNFTLNGVEHAAGTFRVAAVEKDGVCERQGACTKGDVVVAIGGKTIAGMPLDEVKLMLRGRPGQSIVLGIYSDQSREIINRHCECPAVSLRAQAHIPGFVCRALPCRAIHARRLSARPSCARMRTAASSDGRALRQWFWLQTRTRCTTRRAARRVSAQVQAPSRGQRGHVPGVGQGERAGEVRAKPVCGWLVRPAGVVCLGSDVAVCEHGHGVHKARMRRFWRVPGDGSQAGPQ